MDGPPTFDQIAEQLRDPIPTLRSLEIRTENRQLHHTFKTYIWLIAYLWERDDRQAVTDRRRIVGGKVQLFMVIATVFFFTDTRTAIGWRVGHTLR